MLTLGKIQERDIFYIKVRENQDYAAQLPSDNWLVFTIANKTDEDLLLDASVKCMDKNVCYICCAGELASIGDSIFDIEIVNRAILQEDETGIPYNHNCSPMTTWHTNFEEGFWFASVLAYDNVKDIHKVVCLDFTILGVKKHLLHLISVINQDWLPSDEEYLAPIYDS